MAGDATGIILAATVTALLGLPMWIDLATEYAAGFIFGLLIFQALFMKDMMGGSYLGAAARFLPAGVAVDERHDGRDVPGHGGPDDGPRHARHGAHRSSCTGRPCRSASSSASSSHYPVNVWLVANGLKHGMGSTQPAEPTDVNEPTTIAHQEGVAA